MAFNPIPNNTTLRLYSLPNYGENEEPVARNKSALNNYLNSRVVLENVNCSYMRKTGRFKLQMNAANMQSLNTVNLCSFINPNFENLVIYAKVTGWEYINNKTAEISFSVDWWMTYMGLVNFGGGFIEREHLSAADFAKAEANPWDPTIYEFQTDEGLAVGQTMYEPPTNTILYPDISKPESNFFNKCVLIFVSNFNEETIPGGMDALTEWATEWVNPYGHVSEHFNPDSGDLDLLMPHAYYIFVLYGNEYAFLNKMLDALTAAGLGDSILSIKYTYRLIWTRYKEYNKIGAEPATTRVHFPTVGTKWKNKKLYRSPFHYLEVQNNTGDKRDYCYEYAVGESGDNPTYIDFLYTPVIEVDCYVSLVPKNYFGSYLNMSERMDTTPWPEVGYSTDAFVGFLASKNQEILSKRYGILETAPEKALDFVNDKNLVGLGLTGALGKYLGGGVPDINLGSGTLGGVYGTIGALKGVKEGGNLAGAITGSVLGAAEGYDKGKQYGLATEYKTDPLAGAEYYGQTKAAYAVDKYQSGTQPALSYGLDFTDAEGNKKEFGCGIFLILYRKMRDVILQVFDDMFTQVGYVSKRYGTPRVCNYAKGATGAAVLPHFNDEGFTYCKCQNLHVTGAPMDVTSGIEQMFGAGIRFYKVD